MFRQLDLPGKLVLPANQLPEQYTVTGRGVRVAEGARLESVCAGNCTAGSNPALSARSKQLTL